jgi:hypothetical protein
MISFIITLILIGVALYVINTLIPMDGKIKTVINIVIVLFACLYALNFLNILPTGSFPHLK